MPFAPRVIRLILGFALLGLALAWPGVARAGGEATPTPSLATSAEQVPRIEVYTMGVGEHFTEKFGHAALCTRYPSNPRRDRCYNYGTTNFADPVGLGWKFLRAQSRFWVSVTTPDDMIDFYIRRDRSIWVQELTLSDEQALAIADKLHFDSLEANRYYRYHHYFDNCTTRVRDILDKATDGKLSKDSDKPVAFSYRDLTRQGFASAPLLLVVSDYILGRIGDRKPSAYAAMFLPDIFREAVRERLGAEPVTIYERHGRTLSQNPGPYRLLVAFLSLLLVVPIWLGFREGSVKRRHLALAVPVLTIVGILVWGLALVSPLPMARFNEVLLLYFPGDLALLLLALRYRRRYAQVRVVIALLATAAAGVGILHQPLWAMATLPILALVPLALLPARAAIDEPGSGAVAAPAASGL